jgi:hypothetical protein
VKRSFTAAAGLAATGVDRDWLARVLTRVEPSEVPVREAPRWFRALWARGIAAVAMPWAVYMTPAMMDRYETAAEPHRLGRLLVHELAHIEQFRRLGAIRHVGQYTFDYLLSRLQRKGHWGPYTAVRLEIEARGVAALVMDGPR